MVLAPTDNLAHEASCICLHALASTPPSPAEDNLRALRHLHDLEAGFLAVAVRLWLSSSRGGLPRWGVGGFLILFKEDCPSKCEFDGGASRFSLTDTVIHPAECMV